jgi:cysteinyl-tRNA synthetase
MFSIMKSAYELAMERLAKAEGATRPLSAEQKQRLAEIDRVYQGKIAEREIFLKQKLDEALAGQQFDEADQLRKQMAGEKARLEEERESEKERVRRG